MIIWPYLTGQNLLLLADGSLFCLGCLLWKQLTLSIQTIQLLGDAHYQSSILHRVISDVLLKIFLLMKSIIPF